MPFATFIAAALLFLRNGAHGCTVGAPAGVDIMALHDIYSGREFGRSSASPLGDAHSGEDGNADRLDFEQQASERASVRAAARRLGVLLLLSLILCGGAGAAYVALTPPRYVATTALLIEPQRGAPVGGGVAAASQTAIEAQAGRITSRPVLMRAAGLAQLQNDPEFNGTDRTLPQRLLHPRTLLEGGVDLRALEDAVTVTRPDRTAVVEVVVAARHAAAAAAIANAVTAAYLDDGRAPVVRDDPAQASGDLAASAALAARIKALDERIADAKAKNQAIQSSGLHAGEQQVADLTRALGDARAKADAAKARADEATALAKVGRIDGASASLMSPALETLRQDQAEAEQNAARLAQTLGDRHPDMREAKERQATARAQTAAELGRLRTASTGDYRAAQATAARLEAALDRAKEQVGQIGRSLLPTDQMESERAALRTSLERATQVDAGRVRQDAGSLPGRVISAARPPVAPSSPNTMLVALAAVSSGLILGLLGALVGERAAPSRPGSLPVRNDAPRVGDPRDAEPRSPTRRYWTDDES